MQLKFDEKGLICAVAQDCESGEVLMQAYMNLEAYEKTLETGYAHYYSRSRQKLSFPFPSIATATAFCCACVRRAPPVIREIIPVFSTP